MRHLSFSTKIMLGLGVIMVTIGYFSLPREELFRSPEQSYPNPTGCSKEAKACPDGSSVGRVGPRCEFAACPLTTSTDEADHRILLDQTTISNIYEKFPAGYACSLKFNTEPATTSTTYRGYGISLQVPYNPAWGTANYRIGPYGLYDYSGGKSLEFGAMGPFEGCSLVRAYSLKFLPPRSANEIIESMGIVVRTQVIKGVSQQYTFTSGGDPLPVPPTTVKINNLTVVKYKISGMCGYPTLEVIGTRFNYELRPLCNGNFEEIEDIVRTAELVD